MGTFIHEAVIVTGVADYVDGNDVYDEIETLHHAAVEIFGHLVTPIIKSKVNAFASFAVMPCGSKFGFEIEHEHEKNLDKFEKILNTSHVDSVKVTYGECFTEAEDIS